MDERIFYLGCQCGCAVISVELLPWPDETNKYVYFQYYGNYHPGLVQRIKTAWRILRYGYSGLWDVMLTPEGAITLGMTLQEEAGRCMKS